MNLRLWRASLRVLYILEELLCPVDVMDNSVEQMTYFLIEFVQLNDIGCQKTQPFILTTL